MKPLPGTTRGLPRVSTGYRPPRPGCRVQSEVHLPEASHQGVGLMERFLLTLRNLPGSMKSLATEGSQRNHHASPMGPVSLSHNLLLGRHLNSHREEAVRLKGAVPSTVGVTCRIEAGKCVGTERRIVPTGSSSCARAIEGERTQEATPSHAKEPPAGIARLTAALQGATPYTCVKSAFRVPTTSAEE